MVLVRRANTLFSKGGAVGMACQQGSSQVNLLVRRANSVGTACQRVVRPSTRRRRQPLGHRPVRRAGGAGGRSGRGTGRARKRCRYRCNRRPLPPWMWGAGRRRMATRMGCRRPRTTHWLMGRRTRTRMTWIGFRPTRKIRFCVLRVSTRSLSPRAVRTGKPPPAPTRIPADPIPWSGRGSARVGRRSGARVARSGDRVGRRRGPL